MIDDPKPGFPIVRTGIPKFARLMTLNISVRNSRLSGFGKAKHLIQGNVPIDEAIGTDRVTTYKAILSEHEKVRDLLSRLDGNPSRPMPVQEDQSGCSRWPVGQVAVQIRVNRNFEREWLPRAHLKNRGDLPPTQQERGDVGLTSKERQIRDHRCHKLMTDVEAGVSSLCSQVARILRDRRRTGGLDDIRDVINRV